MIKHLPCRSHPFLSVCTPPFPSSHFSFFFHSPFLLRFVALTPSSLLPVSWPFPVFVSFFRRRLVSRGNSGVVHFTAVPTASPKSQSIYSLRPPLRIGEFSFPRPSTILPPVCLPSSHTSWIGNQQQHTHTHTHVHVHTLTYTYTQVNRNVVRFCLWQRKAISRLFQSSVITWNVSLSGGCFIRLGPWLKPF